jgi:hypothetical protein
MNGRQQDSIVLLNQVKGLHGHDRNVCAIFLAKPLAMDMWNHSPQALHVEDLLPGELSMGDYS